MTRFVSVVVGGAVCVLVAGCPPPVTYHGDTLRTGWNALEGTLTTANVSSSSFGLIASATLDDQVDAQPLVVGNQKVNGNVYRAVVYVATESNTLYAIDGLTGTVIKSVNLGPPVYLPLGCVNNGPNVGIGGTPTIDVQQQTLYLIAYVQTTAGPQYQLHALDLSTLSDKPGSPAPVGGTHLHTDGSVARFQAQYQRQRPALLEANGNVYAGFGSFCDFSADQSIGWVLGWNATTLTALPNNFLSDRLATTPPYPNWQGTTYTPFLLAAVWMSGFGLSADSNGHLYLATGNGNAGSGPNQLDSAMKPVSLQESVVKLSPDLTLADWFTPSAWSAIDAADGDVGVSGVLVLPDQPGLEPHMAVVAPKDGSMFILNRDNLGQLHTPDVPPAVQIGAAGCDCHWGPSYFKGTDGVGRIVASAGTQVQVWKVVPPSAGSPATLTLEGTSSVSVQDATQDNGFFTSVSSSLTSAGTGIIWALGRPGPASGGNAITLYAFNAVPSGGVLNLLWNGIAGSWPNTGGNANLVPTVSDGRVYVASYQKLAIFGLVSGPPKNACGGTAHLADAPETSCKDPATGRCGVWKCLGPAANAVTCDTTAGGAGVCGHCGVPALPGSGHARGDSCFCGDAALSSGTLVCGPDGGLICCPCHSAPGCGPGSPPSRSPLH